MRNSYLGHLFTLRDGLTASAGSLGQADQTHVHQLAHLIELREDRDELRDTVYEKFSIMRRIIAPGGPTLAGFLANLRTAPSTPDA